MTEAQSAAIVAAAQALKAKWDALGGPDMLGHDGRALYDAVKSAEPVPRFIAERYELSWRVWDTKYGTNFCVAQFNLDSHSYDQDVERHAREHAAKLNREPR